MNHDCATPTSVGAAQNFDHEMLEVEHCAYSPGYHWRGNSAEQHRPQSADTVDMEIDATTKPRALFMVPEDCFIHVLKFLSAGKLCALAQVSKDLSLLTSSDMFWNKLCIADYGATSQTILEAYTSAVPRDPPAFWKRMYKALLNYRIQLHFVSGPRKDDSELVPMEGECMLGRSRQNNVCILHDEMVSRKHAKILRRNGHYFIHDVGGINFTFINKRVIPQHCDYRLHIDDTVDMGSSTFIVCLIPPTSDACSTEGVEDMQPAAETHAAKC